jgi:hypothetical protein
MRRAAKVDANQPELVELWRGAYLSVQHIHTIGSGCPDVILGAPGLTIVSRQLDPAIIDFVLKKMGLTQYAIHERCNLLVEIKASDKAALTPDEEQWHRLWVGQKCIVHNEAEARRIVGLED